MPVKFGRRYTNEISIQVHNWQRINCFYEMHLAQQNKETTEYNTHEFLSRPVKG